jgi:DNA-binding transcriptional LysR family regulator
MVEIRYLRHFLEVAEAGGFRQAARNIGLSAPTLVRSVKMLEDAYGVPLLTRTRSKVTPTEYGHQLLRHSRMILAELESIPDHLGKMKGFIVGRLRVGISPVIMDLCTQPVVSQLVRNHPDVEIAISVGRADILLKMLSDGDVDLIMCTEHPLRARENLEIQHLYSEEAFLYVRSGHPIADGRRVPAKAFLEYPFIHQKLPAIYREWKNDLAIAVRRETEESMDTTGSIECADYELLVKTVLETDAMALLPRRNSLIRGRDRLLKRLEFPVPFPVFKMSASYPLSTPAPPLAGLIIDMMRQEISRLSPGRSR